MLEKLKIIAEYFPFCITIVDTKAPGRPCLYANQIFTENTGYPVEEVIGKNLAFLQGRRTATDTIEFMRKCFKEEVACVQDMINYKKDGEEFVNRLLMLPMKFKSDVFYLGFQNNITKKSSLLENNQNLRGVTDGEIRHVVNNAMSVILGKMTLTLMKTNDEDELKKMAQELSHHFEKINRFILEIEDLSTFADFTADYKKTA